MQFMIVIYGGPRLWRGLSQADIDRVGDTHRSIQAALTRSGELVDHRELETEGSRVVGPGGGGRVAGGPLEWDGAMLGGYYLVDCVDMARATEIAGSFAEAEFAPLEVRRLSDATSWDERTPTG